MQRIIVFIVIISCIVHIRGESYERQEKRASVVDELATCQRFSSSQCQGTVFYNVYVNETYSQQTMSILASRLITITNLPGIPESCRYAATQLICSEYFPKCEIVHGTPIAISVPPCHSLCLTVLQECSSLLALDSNLLNCDKIDPRTNLPAYPIKSVQYMLPDGTLREYSCNDMIPTDYFPSLVLNGGFEQTSNENTTAIGIPAWSINPDFAENLSIRQDNVTGDISRVVSINVTKSSDGSNSFAIKQFIALNRRENIPMKLSAMSKSEETNLERIITVDMFHQDGTNETKTLQFATGTFAYEEKEILIHPMKPIHNVTIQIYVKSAGVAYFDNIALQEKVPEVNKQPLCIAPYLRLNPKRNEFGEDPCKIACPAPIYDYPALFRFTLYFQLVLSWISLIIVTFLIVTWMVFPWKRKYPSRLVINFSVATWILSFRFAVMSFYDIDDTICEDEITILTSDSNSFCAFVGFFYTFGVLSIISWWFSIVVSTYVMIRYHMKQQNFQWLEKYFHLTTWTIALSGSFLGLFGSGYSAGTASAGGCWISGKDGAWWQLGIFYIPLGIALFVALMLIGHAMYIIHRSTHAEGKGNKKTYLRLGCFILIIMITLVVTFLQKFSFYGREEEIKKEFEKYAICKSINDSDCGEAPHLSSLVLFIHQICASSQGIFFFIFFIKKDILLAWKEKLKNNKIVYRYFSGNTKSNTQQDKV